jgi:hypothetical protein
MNTCALGSYLVAPLQTQRTTMATVFVHPSSEKRYKDRLITVLERTRSQEGDRMAGNLSAVTQ